MSTTSSRSQQPGVAKPGGGLPEGVRLGATPHGGGAGGRVEAGHCDVPLGEDGDLAARWAATVTTMASTGPHNAE